MMTMTSSEDNYSLSVGEYSYNLVLLEDAVYNLYQQFYKPFNSVHIF